MFELRVLNGLHQGAALPLVGEQWLIGADAGHDLALYDPGIAALHCRLSRNGDGWSLDAEDGLFNDDEGHALTATVLTPNQTFALGNVWLCLAPAAEAWPQVPMRLTPEQSQPLPEHDAPPLPKPRWSYAQLAYGVMLGMVVGAAGAHWGQNSSTGVSAPGVISQNADNAPFLEPQLASSAGKIRLADREAIRQLLHTMLSDRLLTQVSIEDISQGLSLTGKLQGDALAMYRRMLSSFNERYAPSLPVLDNVATSDAGLPFVIAQVISGSNAHLVTADGHRMYVGDQFDGLRLTRIDDKRLEFDGDQHLEVHW